MQNELHTQKKPNVIKENFSTFMATKIIFQEKNEYFFKNRFTWKNISENWVYQS